ncbi:uncharacterized protein LOC124184198 [Neodiprion fabricii]|uniref:uncharacterized protein LOC124184198 n=1 Tax=Neodiprion fabricii TaxID=2872261 RepID=UPI001ED94B9D|nr:uncharacterized protein LOC124184198 [Neodiprion fabricii]
MPQRTSPGYCRARTKIRTLNTTKWELPISGSKAYWDKICDDLEKRKEHVSDSSQPPSPSPNDLIDPNVNLNRDVISANKPDHIVEPLVKIFPPTPMGLTPENLIFRSLDSLIINKNDTDRVNKNYLITNSSRAPNNDEITQSKNANLYDISVCVTDFLKTKSMQTRKTCQIHKNVPPLKIFDDNLKRFLPKKKFSHKLSKSPMTVLPSNALDPSKLHRTKFCPYRNQPVSGNDTEFSTGLMKNRKRWSRSLRRCKTAGFNGDNVENNFAQFLKVPKFPGLSLHSSSKQQGLSRKSKSEIIKSNLNHILSIPKLNEIGIDENLFIISEDETSEDTNVENSDRNAKASLDCQNKVQTMRDEYNAKLNLLRTQKFDTPNSERSVLKSTTNFDPILSQSVKLPKLPDELSPGFFDGNRVTITRPQVKPEKDFLKVPKLGAISSYPSFSKLTADENVEVDENVKSSVQRLIRVDNSRSLTVSDQRIELDKRNYLKVPKLGMMSSYPSFTSLIPDSFDSDDNANGGSDSTSKYPVGELSNDMLISSKLNVTQDTLISFDKPTALSSSGGKPLSNKTSAEVLTAQNVDISPTVANYSQSEKPIRRYSLKNSVRYAYKALKFLTRNKNLDFKPQSYQRLQKSSSSGGSSNSSQVSKYSKFEPAIKLLTYEDISNERRITRSASSSTYSSMKSRLKHSASQYLGSDYIFSNSNTRPATSSTTILSSTRSTSGPTPEFQVPVLERPSDVILSKLPAMSIFPRKKNDKCLACLYNAFKKPIESRIELPLAVRNAVGKEPIVMSSESESSSISLPDMKDLLDSNLEYDDDWTGVLKGKIKSPLLDKIDWKSSRSSLHTSSDPQRFRQPFARASEDIQSRKNDPRLESVKKNLSPKDSTATNNFPKPVSLSSDHSKPSSLSGHSSESDEPQVQVKQTVPTSECVVSPYAPLHWAPSLDPLKSLKLRKPVSMHGRAISITKTEDDSGSDENIDDYRSARKEKKVNKLARKNDENANVDPSIKSNLVKQPSIAAKMITSQISTLMNLSKKLSRVDLLSNYSKAEDQTTPQHQQSITAILNRTPEDMSEELNVGVLNEKEQPEIDSNDRKMTDQSLLESTDAVNLNQEEVKVPSSIESTSMRFPLPQITEQTTENESLVLSENEKLDSDKTTSSRIRGIPNDPDKPQNLIYSDERVTKILEKCIEENRTPFEMLEALSAEAINSDAFKFKNATIKPEIAHSAKVAKNLIKLLVNSRKYLNPNTFSPHLEFSSPQTPLCNPRQLRRVLPAETYSLVARILGMPENPVNKSVARKSEIQSNCIAEDPFRLGQSYNRALSADSCDMIVHPPSAHGKKKSVIDEDEFEYPQLSPYALFINKPRRKAIKWRPLTERDMLGYDPEATLSMRATRVTNKICEDFCTWLRGLGGGQSDDIDEEVLKDMFQIEFTAEACRAMQVLVKEIPMVPIAVAVARNTPGAGELALTRRHLIRDAKAESMLKKTIGFGSMLPRTLRFIPPKNRVDEKWLQCENVPRDLETMEAVWKGITHLDSVKGFLAWVEAHPGVKPPKILTEAYAKKEVLLRQQSIEEAGGHTELEMDQIKSLKVGDAD